MGHKMKNLAFLTIFCMVIAGHGASLDGDLKKVGVDAICQKQCDSANKFFKKKFDKACPEQVCKNEKVKENIFKQFDKKVEKFMKKHGCEEVCIKTFVASEEEHDHDHEEEKGNGAGFLTGSVLTILMTQFL